MHIVLCDIASNTDDIFNRFINIRHHDGQWLHAVQSMEEQIDLALDDNDGARTIEKVKNMLGNVDINIMKLSVHLHFSGLSFLLLNKNTYS